MQRVLKEQDKKNNKEASLVSIKCTYYKGFFFLYFYLNNLKKKKRSKNKKCYHFLLVLTCPVWIKNIIDCILREYGGKVNCHLKALVCMWICFGYYSHCWLWPTILTIQPHCFHPFQSLCIAVPFVFIPYFSKFSTLFNSKWCWLVVQYTNIYIYTTTTNTLLPFLDYTIQLFQYQPRRRFREFEGWMCMREFWRHLFLLKNWDW